MGVVLLAVALVGPLGARRSRALIALAAVPLLGATALTVYVFGEDDYRDNGMTRWEAYRSPGGALGPMFVLSIALMVAFAVLIAYATVARRHALLRAAAGAAGATALLLLIPTALGFTLN